MSKLTPEVIATRITEKLFEGRKGHGGAPASYIQMSAQDLRLVIGEAVKLSRSTGLQATVLAYLSEIDNPVPDAIMRVNLRNRLRELVGAPPDPKLVKR